MLDEAPIEAGYSCLEPALLTSEVRHTRGDSGATGKLAINLCRSW